MLSFLFGKKSKPKSKSRTRSTKSKSRRRSTKPEYSPRITGLPMPIIDWTNWGNDNPSGFKENKQFLETIYDEEPPANDVKEMIKFYNKKKLFGDNPTTTPRTDRENWLKANMSGFGKRNKTTKRRKTKRISGRKIKLSSKIRKMCKKYKVKTTVKRGSRRVQKSLKLIMKQLKKKMKSLRRKTTKRRMQ